MWIRVAFFIFHLSALLSCSSFTPPRPEEPTIGVYSIQKLLLELNQRLENLEKKFNTTAAPAKQTLKTHPSENFGIPPEKKQIQNSSTEGFINDEATQDFREAFIFYQAEKFPETILSFSDFIEKHPDHPLSGNAQFYIAKAYFKQKELRLAAQEFNLFLKSYPHNAHLPEALRDLASLEKDLGNLKESKNTYQLLQLLFPHSPVANQQGPL